LKEINQQNALRNEYLKSEKKKAKRDDGFDDTVRKSLEKDAPALRF
jgi:hypothetical protein